MKTNQAKQKVTEKVGFAGSKIEITRDITSKDWWKEERELKRAKTASGLDELSTMIDNSDRTLNVIEKTKIDWDNHTKEANIEKELD